MSLYSGRAIVSALTKLGFEQVSQVGSHVKMKNGAGRTVIVPMHREVKRGTFASVMRQAGVSEDVLKSKM